MNSVTFVGNLTAEPQLIGGSSGISARAVFTVGVSEGQGLDERTNFVNVTVWGSLARNLVHSLRSGDRVIVVGKLNCYARKVTVDGEEKSLALVSFIATAVGPDLRWASAKVSKAEPDSHSGESTSRGKSSRGKWLLDQSPAEDSDDDDF